MVKRPASLLIFGMMGAFSSLVCITGILCFTIAGSPIFVYVPLSLSILLILISSTIGMFQFKKWGRNIVIAITLISNSLFVWFASVVGSEHKEIIEISIGELKFDTWDILEISFMVVFVIYFILPSTRKLFNEPC